MSIGLHVATAMGPRKEMIDIFTRFIEIGVEGISTGYLNRESASRVLSCLSVGLLLRLG